MCLQSLQRHLSVCVNNGKISTCRHIWIGSLANPVMTLTRPRLDFTLSITGRWAYRAISIPSPTQHFLRPFSKRVLSSVLSNGERDR